MLFTLVTLNIYLVCSRMEWVKGSASERTNGQMNLLANERMNEKGRNDEAESKVGWRFTYTHTHTHRRSVTYFVIIPHRNSHRTVPNHLRTVSEYGTIEINRQNENSIDPFIVHSDQLYAMDASRWPTKNRLGKCSTIEDEFRRMFWKIERKRWIEKVWLK